MPSLDVVGIGNPLLDHIASVRDADLASLGLVKGTMRLIGEGDARHLLGLVSTAQRFPGGSCCNTMLGLAHLGGKAAYIGAVGEDEQARFLENALASRGVVPLLVRRKGITGACVVLLSEDAERTLNTHLGAAQSLTAADIRERDIQNASYLHLEGYLWDTSGQAAAAERAVRLAKKLGVRVSLDLADPFAVERHRDTFLRLLPDCDVLFANEEEARIFTGFSAEEAAPLLAKRCPFVVVKLGAKGSLIVSERKAHQIAPFQVPAVDTTGAGDIYASAVLYGLTHGLSPEKTGRLASYAAGQVVAQRGAQLTSPVDMKKALSP
ncbi:adenosine kinase [Candidatus Woesearchaeota archaeon]|nr:adenosine kinase [Candidatus Woesearchaeota archaeon]